MPSEHTLRSKSSRYVLALGVLISLLLSWLSIRNNQVLSPDSLLYIYTAQTFLDHGIVAAAEVYRWPQLSVLIAAIHKITGLPLTTSGELITSCFYAGLTCAFISLVKDLGGSVRTQLIALIIVCFFPTINEYRDYITRDAGFWMFSLLSLQQLIRFASKGNLKHALTWFLFTISAIAFRTEALFFAAFAPLAFLFDSHLSRQQKIRNIAVLYGLFAVFAVLAIGFIIATPALSEKFRLFSEILNFDAFFGGLFSHFNESMQVISDAKPYAPFVDDINTIFILGLAGLVFYTIFSALTLPYAVIAFWPIKTVDRAPLTNKTTYLASYFIITVGYLLIKTFYNFFASNRYCLLSALIILLLLPFKVSKLWANIKSPNQALNWQKTCLLLLLLYPVLDSLINSDSAKEYIADATTWVKQQHQDGKRLLTNHKQIAVLGGNCWEQCVVDDALNLIEKAKVSPPELLAIRLKHNETERIKAVETLAASASWTVTKSFSNHHNDRVLILTYHPSLQPTASDTP